jgi:hypothetical protein
VDDEEAGCERVVDDDEEDEEDCSVAVHAEKKAKRETMKTCMGDGEAQ